MSDVTRLVSSQLDLSQPSPTQPNVRVEIKNGMRFTFTRHPDGHITCTVHSLSQVLLARGHTITSGWVDELRARYGW